MIFGTSIAILTSVFPTTERGKVLGINSAAVYAGLSSGPVLGGFLTQKFGWRSIFFFSVSFGLFIFILIAVKIKKEWFGDKNEKFDFFGAIVYCFSLTTLMYSVSSMNSSKVMQWLFLIGLISFFVFIKWELKVQNPIIDLRLFTKNRMFAFSNFAALLVYGSTFSSSFLLSLYLTTYKKP